MKAVIVLLAACTTPSVAQPDATTSCAVKTVTGGELHSCTVANVAGLCTGDLRGRVQCFPVCTERFECALGSPYVLAIGDGGRVCYCDDERSL